MEQMLSIGGVQQMLQSPEFEQMASNPAVSSMVNSMFPGAASSRQQGSQISGTSSQSQGGQSQTAAQSMVVQPGRQVITMHTARSAGMMA